MPIAVRKLPRLRSRYRLNGRWFKGALHTHTTVSDGRWSLAETVDVYRKAGFDFVCITDHQRISKVGGMQPNGLLLLDGVEFQGFIGHRRMLHIVAVEPQADEGALTGGLRATCERLRASGALLIGAHPHWSGATFTDFEGRGLHGIEIFNYGCRRDTNKACGLAHWDHMLTQGDDVLGFAVDDTHGNPRLLDWCGGWVMVNAPRLEPRSLLRALRRGNFYSSSGPEIRSLRLHGGKVEIETSPIIGLRLLGHNGYGGVRWFPPDQPITEFSMELPPKDALVRKWRYIRLEVEDAQGRVAWTNTLYLSSQ